MTSLMQFLKAGPLANLRQSGIYIALAVIIVLFAVLTDGSLLT